MDAYSRESFRFGTLRGFKHFRVELRGREEMLLTFDVSHAALSGGHVPLAPMSLQSALPPASPCQREGMRAPWEDEQPKKVTTVSYLLAGYAHYNCPLAWVRSGHSLVGSAFQNPGAMDAPVELQAAQAFKTQTVSRAFHAHARSLCRPPPWCL
jgi:hypothetical protein